MAALAAAPTRRAAGLLTCAAYCAALLFNGGLGGPVATSVAALPPGLVAAVAALGAARRSEAEPKLHRWLRRSLVLPGALLIGFASGLATDPTWIPLVAVGAVALAAPAMARFDRRWGTSGLPPVMLAVSVGGLFYTLPDPEEAAILLGVSLPLALLATPPVRRAYGPAGSWVVAGLFVWAVAAGGYGRASAVFGGIACLSLFLSAPIADLVRPHRDPPSRGGALIAVHAIIVLLAARVAGLQDNGVSAVAIAIAVIAGGATAVWAIGHSAPLGRTRRPMDQSSKQGPFTHGQETGPDEEDVDKEGDGHDRRANQ